MKFFIFFSIFVFILIVVFFIIIKILLSKISKNKDLIFSLEKRIDEKENRIKTLMEDMEIEKKHNSALAKKLANIAGMSIDDVLNELQNN